MILRMKTFVAEERKDEGLQVDFTVVDDDKELETNMEKNRSWVKPSHLDSNIEECSLWSTQTVWLSFSEILKCKKYRKGSSTVFNGLWQIRFI